PLNVITRPKWRCQETFSRFFHVSLTAGGASPSDAELTAVESALHATRPRSGVGAGLVVITRPTFPEARPHARSRAGISSLDSGGTRGGACCRGSRVPLATTRFARACYGAPDRGPRRSGPREPWIRRIASLHQVPCRPCRPVPENEPLPGLSRGRSHYDPRR